MERELVSIFYVSETKEILIRYSRIILPASKDGLIPKFERCGSKIEPITPI